MSESAFRKDDGATIDCEYPGDNNKNEDGPEFNVTDYWNAPGTAQAQPCGSVLRFLSTGWD